jgi:hypothetical protein
MQYKNRDNYLLFEINVQILIFQNTFSPNLIALFYNQSFQFSHYHFYMN